MHLKAGRDIVRKKKHETFCQVPVKRQFSPAGGDGHGDLRQSVTLIQWEGKDPPATVLRRFGAVL